MDSSAEALTEDHNDSHSDTLTVTERHDAFVNEAFIYLLDYFKIQAKTGGEFTYFKETTGRAIVTLSYVFRRRLRTFFKNAQINLGDINEFQKIVRYFEIVKDSCYFFSILKRISHVFEFTIFCLKEGYNYVKTARECFSIHDDTEFFEKNGGLDRLNEIALFIFEVGEIFYTVIREENPQDIVLKSYVEAVETLERPYEASVLVIYKGLLSTMKNDALNQLQNIQAVDHRFLKVFYLAVFQHSSKIFVMHPEYSVVNYEMDIFSEMEAIIYSFRSILKLILGEYKHTYVASSIRIKLAGCFVIFRHMTDLISTELENEQPEHELWTQSPYSPEKCYSLKEYFLVSQKYIRMKKFEQHSIVPKHESFDDLMQPSIKSMFIRKLRKVVDANIQQNNYFQLNNGWYVVYTPDCKFHDNTTCVIFNEHIEDS